jgi:hypothetical protein
MRFRWSKPLSRDADCSLGIGHGMKGLTRSLEAVVSECAVCCEGLGVRCFGLLDGSGGTP